MRALFIASQFFILPFYGVFAGKHISIKKAEQDANAPAQHREDRPGHTGRFIITIGKVPEQPQEAVDDNVRG